jgi:integrase
VFSDAFKKVVARSGLPRIRLHDLRHTHATLLLKAGVPIKVVSERLGHSTPAFTMATYQHVLPGMQAEAARTFAAILDPSTGSTRWNHPETQRGPALGGAPDLPFRWWRG